MASLLGGEYCIESLRQDVKDLQAILGEVHSRVGQVKYQSWKFPDKASCDVDVTSLLERCHYNQTDEEECQMSHVMLYDIIIDRLVYLLQSFICFNEILLNVRYGSIQISPISSYKKGSSIRSMSVGLTVKKCWSRITQLAALLQKLAKEVNSTSSLAATKHLANAENQSNSSASIASDRILYSISSQDAIKSPAATDKDVSCDNRTTGCQTAETAYTFCETCLRTQSCLHDVGRAIVDLCRVQNLPTALEDYQIKCNESVPMSVADLVRWGKHQAKDLSRISRHMTSLINQVTPLKADLASVQKSEKAVRSELQMCQAVYDRKEVELREEFRRREYSSKEVEKDLKKKISTLENVKMGMQEEIDKCQWKVSDLKDELLQKHRDHLAMENAMSQLKEEAVEGHQYKQDALKFKNELARVYSEFENLKQSLNHDRKLYQSELTKNENMSQHEKMLQEKQRTLLTRMETINEECEKLRDGMLTLEEERDAALAELGGFKKNQSDEEITSQQYQAFMDLHQKEVELLHQNIRSQMEENEDLKSAVGEYTERERLIVAYPDLNQANVASPMVQGSGDIITDMKEQVEANQIRIQILETENSALLKTLKKVNSAPDGSPRIQSRWSSRATTPRSEDPFFAPGEKIYSQLSQPMQLWKASDLKYAEEQKLDEEQNSHEAQIYQKYRRSKSPQDKAPVRWESFRSKPPTGRQTTAFTPPNKPHRQMDAPEKNGTRFGNDTSKYSASSLEAYKKIKQQQYLNCSQSTRSSFTVGAGKRPKSGRPSSAKSALFKPWA